MKRIAILVPDLSLGGGQRSAVSTAELLALDNIVHIVIFCDENRVFNTEVDVRDLQCPKKASFGGKLLNIYKRYKAFKKLWQQEQYDVVISFLESANLCAYLNNCSKSVLTLHLSPTMLSGFDQRILKHVFKYSNNVVAVSEGLKKHLAMTGHRFKEMSVINNPIDAEKIQALAQKEPFTHPKKFIVSAGRLTRQKRYDVMIDIFLESQASLTHDLIIVGGGEDFEALNQQVKSKPNVHLVGEMKNPFPIIKAAEMFLMTSDYEAFPMVLLEALALEKVVVAYDCPTGLADLIQHKHNGVLVENNDSPNLVKWIDRLISNEVLHFELTKNCLASIEDYTSHSIRQHWSKYLEEIVVKS